MARPKLTLNKEDIEDLAGIGCTTEEIATILEVSSDTIERRFAVSLKKGRARMKESLRRTQFKAAQEGNVTAMIWLGKQYLDQTDKRAVEMTGELQVESLTDVIRRINGAASDRPRNGGEEMEGQPPDLH